MKRLLLFVACFSMALAGYTQTRALFNKSVSEKPRQAEYIKPSDGSEILMSDIGVPIKSSTIFTEEEIGETYYDKQSNRTTANRTFLFEDGTMAATWIFSLESSGFSDRGSAYNYFDGISWGTWPDVRVESQKSGWPAYAPLGENGEIIVSHNAVDALIINRRTGKGTGDWTETLLQGPVNFEKVTWPRVVTTGTDYNTVHILGMIRDYPATGDMTLAYYRSEDGGDSWEISNQEIDGTGHDFYTDLGADSYVFAEPKDDLLAFVVVNIWCDAFLMKSDDNGDSWDKTIIWEHPYPFWDWNTTITTDTLWAPDNSAAIALDSQGRAHVIFGLCRVAHTEAGTTYSYWAFSDGIAYWNEDRPMFEADEPHDALDPIDVLTEDYNLVGWSQDVDNNGVLEFEKDIFSYGQKGISTMPAMVIDEMDRIFFAYASTTETFFDDNYNFKHIWMRASDDGGETWGDFIDITSNLIHLFDECIYPVLTPMSDDHLYLMYNIDAIPGLMVDEDHSATQNKEVFTTILKDELVGKYKHPEKSTYPVVSQNFPNPCRDRSVVEVQLIEKSYLTLEVFSMTGAKVFEIPPFEANAGSHKLQIDAGRLKPGIYMYTVSVGDFEVYHKMIVE
ncbi:MAG: T9SS type A sorting domain-containing protein [Bacteroidales bacterium]|nr:T9SS type A sorting domain-containing protein [Bacteroidales bacterium]